MHVQTPNQICPRDLLHVVQDGQMALVGANQLILPVRKRMGAGGRDLESFHPGDRSQFASKLNHLLSRRPDVVTNFGAEFDDRLVHFGFDVFFQEHFAVGENLLNVRTQLAGFGIDDLEFLLDSESKNITLCARASSNGFRSVSAGFGGSRAIAGQCNTTVWLLHEQIVSDTADRCSALVVIRWPFFALIGGVKDKKRT